MKIVIMTLNVIIILLLSVSLFITYSSHTEIAVTKNEHLHNELIAKIEKESEIVEVKNKYKALLVNVKLAKTRHNEENKLYQLFLIASLLLVVINSWLVAMINRNLSGNT